VNIDRAAYREACAGRWHGEPLRNAFANWHDFEAMRGDLERCLRDFLHNPFTEDFSGTCHNRDGTLTSFLWNLQSAWQPDKSCLRPLLDFCEHYQKIFLRRGLVIYCGMLLDAMREETASDEPQLFPQSQPPATR
jgi:hypothetical protein